MASRSRTASGRAPTKPLGSTTSPPATAKTSSATMIRALSPKPATGGQYSVTSKPKAREAAELPTDVKVSAMPDGSVQLELDGTTLKLTRREARALADKLALASR